MYTLDSNLTSPFSSILFCFSNHRRKPNQYEVGNLDQSIHFSKNSATEKEVKGKLKVMQKVVVKESFYKMSWIKFRFPFCIMVSFAQFLYLDR